MGYILKKSKDSHKVKNDSSISVKPNNDNNGLYKPLSEFAWKDSLKRDKKESAVNSLKHLAF